jgi:hypothetical protein
VGGANDGSSVYQVSHRYALQMEEALLQAEAQLASAELLFATDALSHGPPPQLDLPDGLDSNFLHGVLARLDPGGMDAAAVLRIVGAPEAVEADDEAPPPSPRGRRGRTRVADPSASGSRRTQPRGRSHSGGRSALGAAQE